MSYKSQYRNPRYLAELARSERLRANFSFQFHDARQYAYSAFNVGRLLNATGERPSRIAEMWAILVDLGMNDRRWVEPCEVFSHGEVWGVDGQPRIILGHPFDISPRQVEWLGNLGRYPALRVGVDDRPSHYGFGTHHVRVELVEPRPKFRVLKSTRKTRAYAHAARRAFAEEFGQP